MPEEERKKKGGRRGLDLEESTISRNEEGFFFSLSALKRKRKAELKGEGAGFFFLLLKVAKDKYFI